MHTIKIFLASSAELKEDRVQFELFISRENKKLVKQGLFLELVIWEDFLDAMSPDGLQAEYNKAIRQSDIFVMLYFTKVGKYTAEEFETAFGAFKEDGTPLIFTYFKDASINTGSARKEDLMALWEFQEKLKTLGHYQTVYTNTQDLLLKFRGQLDHLLTAMEDDEKETADEKSRGTYPTHYRGLDTEDLLSRGLSTFGGRPRLVPKFNRIVLGINGPQSGNDQRGNVKNEMGVGPKEGKDEFSKSNLPDEGQVLYSIPEKMQLDHSYRCAVRIAVDRKKLLKGLSKDFGNIKYEKDVRIAEQMEVRFDDTPYFLIDAIGGTQHTVEEKRATEWLFSVRPLKLGLHPLDLLISVVLPSGPVVKVLTKKILVGVEPVEWELVFEEEPLDLEKMTPQQNHSGSGDNVAGDKIGKQVNIGQGGTYNENPTPSEGPQPAKILFVAASPDDMARLKVEREHRAIKIEMGQGRKRELFEFLQPLFGATINDLIRAMSQLPQVVHFSGHGLKGGLVVAKDDGTSQVIPVAAIKLLFKQLKGVGQVVVLNACYSTDQAQEISKYGLYVVGTTEEITEKASLAFSKGLYIGLGEGKPFESAYDDAMVSLLTEAPAESGFFEVWKDGVKVGI